jgi:hypothetical protein
MYQAVATPCIDVAPGRRKQAHGNAVVSLTGAVSSYYCHHRLEHLYSRTLFHGYTPHDIIPKNTIMNTIMNTLLTIPVLRHQSQKSQNLPLPTTAAHGRKTQPSLIPLVPLARALPAFSTPIANQPFMSNERLHMHLHRADLPTLTIDIDIDIDGANYPFSHFRPTLTPRPAEKLRRPRRCGRRRRRRRWARSGDADAVLGRCMQVGGG